MQHRTGDLDRHIGLRLKMLRIMKDITQIQLAKTLNITFQQVQKYEKGVNRISASRIYDISKALDIDIYYFFEDYEKKEINVNEDNNIIENYVPTIGKKRSVKNNDIIMKLLELPQGKQRKDIIAFLEDKLAEHTH